jgi:hypothetical protein
MDRHVLELAITERRQLIAKLIQIEDRAVALSMLVHADHADYRHQEFRSLLSEFQLFYSQFKPYRLQHEQHIYPYLNQYFNLDQGPRMQLSFWRQEKEYELIVMDIQFLMETFDTGLEPIASNRDIMMLKPFIQVCQHMKEYLRGEEILVTPLSEVVISNRTPSF